MTIYLESDTAKVSINEFGAELSSFILKETGVEYIWQANPNYWGRHAPVLFPIVGRLKKNTYTYKGQPYRMNQHGFARDMMFDVIEQDACSVVFELTSNQETLEKYPFEFRLLIGYKLIDNELTTSYEVSTLSDEMYFSIGAHPAFNVPLIEGTTIEDYYLHFYPLKSRIKIPLKGAYINSESKTLAQTNTSIQLNHGLFKEDAQILETKGKNTFSILSEKHPHGVRVSYEKFPFVGFWSPNTVDAPFICIEPWCGIADDVSASGAIEEKIGINKLSKGDIFNRSYTIEII